eukprot:CAMPEP_0114493218 /NCGR_PEP_ID=MMETSP0109-20121206/3989_1 /TAXON_ID=29199 /ORGANISM="Chlorarachnion reptans, Strain CCCM449" /LENGTH=161 /DNA_ID=CAMNT_0001670149 /DNA_START=281 /DNA_END=763 /DNA_ORIENTATION=+
MRPRDVDCDVFGVSYAQTDNKEVPLQVNEGIREFRKKMEEFKTSEGVVSISFYTIEDPPKLRFMSLFTQEKRYHWETWIIPVSIISSNFERGMENPQRVQEHKQRCQMLRTCLTHIIKKVNEDRGHIPGPESVNPATTKEIEKLGCFPFEISYSKSDRSRW